MPVADPNQTESTWSVPFLTFLLVAGGISILLAYKVIGTLLSKVR